VSLHICPYSISLNPPPLTPLTPRERGERGRRGGGGERERREKGVKNRISKYREKGLLRCRSWVQVVFVFGVRVVWCVCVSK